MSSIHIIANPVAGGGAGHTRARELARLLEQRGRTVTVFETRQAGDARRAAETCPVGITVVVGGDGTLNEVLNGLPEGWTHPVAVLPAGTANVVARALGMAPSPARVAEALLVGHTRPMDIGLAGDHRFLLGVGAGLDAAVTRAVQANRGHRSSLMKWVAPAIRTTLHYTYPKIRVVADGRVVAPAADYVIVGNCRYSAGIFPATPRADFADGLLDVCAFSGLSIPRLLWLAARVWSPNYIEESWIDYRQCRAVQLEPLAGHEPAWFQIDGDPAGAIPATITLAAWRLAMVVPAP